MTYANDKGDERTITIKGIDEADSAQGEVSWIAPVARALLKARIGDEVALQTPGGRGFGRQAFADFAATGHGYIHTALLPDLGQISGNAKAP